MSFVAIDLGASGTRYSSNSKQIGILPNNTSFIETVDASGNVMADLTPVKVEVSGNEIEDALEIIVRSSIQEPMYPMHALVGNLADSAGEKTTYPSMLQNKTIQPVNYLSSLLAIAVSKLKYKLDSNINLYLTLPPTEANADKTMPLLEKYLKGHFDVTFPKIGEGAGTTVSFDICSITVTEESAMAVTSFFFDSNGGIQHGDYMNANVLSLDIGSSTTDVIIVKNGRTLKKTGYTIKTGGRAVRGEVMRRVQSEFGMDMSLEAADQALAEGRIRIGRDCVEIRDIINAAKDHVANEIFNKLNTYFTNVAIPVTEIQLVVVSGGGSLESQYINKETNDPVKTSAPMSEFLLKEFSRVNPGLAVENHSDSPRMANIKGLLVRAMFDEAKNQAATKASEAPSQN